MTEQHLVHTHSKSVAGIMHKVVNVLGLAAVAALAACGTILGVAYMLLAWHRFIG